MSCHKISLPTWKMPAEFEGEKGRLNGHIVVALLTGTALLLTSFACTVLFLCEIGLSFHVVSCMWAVIAGLEPVMALIAVDAFLKWQNLSPPPTP